MTEFEFDIIDELYFLQSYEYLLRTLKARDEILKQALLGLVQKGWIKCYSSPAEEQELP